MTSLLAATILGGLSDGVPMRAAESQQNVGVETATNKAATAQLRAKLKDAGNFAEEKYSILSNDFSTRQSTFIR